MRGWILYELLLTTCPRGTNKTLHLFFLDLAFILWASFDPQVGPQAICLTSLTDLLDAS